MNRTKQPFLIVLILLITVAMLLAACGESLTATPVPTRRLSPQQPPPLPQQPQPLPLQPLQHLPLPLR